jgi:integrase
MGMANDYRATIYGRPATVRAKLSLFDNHIAPYARPQAVQGFVDRVMEDWKENKLSMGTIKTLFSILKDFVKFAWKHDLDTKRLNFLHFGDRVKPQNKIKAWTKEQVKIALIESWNCNSPEFYYVLAVTLGTGMRRGEIFALTWADIDLFKGEITISKSLDLDTMEVGPTKTKQTRTVEMSKGVAKIFAECYTPGKEGDRCFKAFNPNQKLKAMCKRHGLPVISFHDLRHTFATTCLEKGLSPKWVSATLGHAKLSTTFDVYWQCFREKQNMENLYE